MSEPRLISPMLDGCIIGEAISCHNGVRCCPAIRQSTGEKFIVKIISVPASQVQLDALLLTGACADNDAAAAYFMEQAQNILKEKDILASLSRLEGFNSFEDAQIVPMEEGVGYEVYLLGPYRKSMERMMATDTLTHLGVVNMGIDLCAALTASRRSGFLYADLKPGNIFLNADKDYRIGDLGFVPMASLRYTTLPEKYHSPYTPAEVLDTMSVLNDTVDVYALGLVLYQAYNGNQLPERAEDGSIPAPLYADYEMAEIILKACHTDPAQRWQDPAQMGQALVSYMQRNTVNDDPIIPPVLETPEAEGAAEETEDQVEEFLPETDPEPEELAFLQELTQDETAPNEENTEDLEDAPLSEETSQMLAQADDLLAMELPEPVVAPEAMEVPMPEPIEVPIEPIVFEPQEPEAEAVEFQVEEAVEEAPEEEAPAGEPAVQPEEGSAAEAPREEGKRKIRVKSLVAVLLLLIMLAWAVMGGWYYYENIYLQHINDLTVTGTEEMLTVHIDSQIDDALLTVYVTDSYGNALSSPVSDGIAVFQALDPNTRYSIRVEISGLHKLTGDTTSSYTTADITEIVNLSAVIGATDGSVLLSFGVNGADSTNWIVTYKAPGQAEKTQTFSGHSVSVNGLTLGAEYQFTISSADGLTVTGTDSVIFMASKLVFAQDLTITACGGGKLTAVWNVPEGETVASWIVRCYDEKGYNQTLTVTEPTVTFTDLDHSSTCTVEVFAQGMSQSAFTTVNANPITITSTHFDDTIAGLLKLEWTFSGQVPEGGWIITYTTDGLAQQVLTVDPTYAELFVVPGSRYEVTISAANNASVFGGTTTYDLPQAPVFADYGLTTADMTAQLCLRPDKEFWSAADVPASDYIDSFAKGQKAAMVIKALKPFESSADHIRVTYLVRDSEGTLVHADVVNSLWSNILPSEYGALNIPFMPEQTGAYTISIYFNGKLFTVQNFSIV